MVDDVYTFSGSTILGRITIGKGSVFGGNVWLTRSVAPKSNVTQSQLRRVGTMKRKTVAEAAA